MYKVKAMGPINIIFDNLFIRKKRHAVFLPNTTQIVRQTPVDFNA